MDPAEYARMHALEDWYWWFVARRRAAAVFLQEYAPPDRPLRVLDAGCGTGGMLDLLTALPGVEPVGLDVADEALVFTRQRGRRRLVGATLTQLPFRDDAFGAVTALDVLEHVADDHQAARELSRVLRPGGVLVASVPAYPFLWGPHDQALHHHRRYRREPFVRLLESAGLTVEKQTYLLSALFPLAVAQRMAARLRRSAGAGLPRVPGLVNRALIGFQEAELAVARRLSLPFGLSILAVARKPVLVRPAVPSVEEALPATAAAAG